jgi:hypothetical protein
VCPLPSKGSTRDNTTAAVLLFFSDICVDRALEVNSNAVTEGPADLLYLFLYLHNFYITELTNLFSECTTSKNYDFCAKLFSFKIYKNSYIYVVTHI